MKTFPRLTIVDKTNLQPGELIHMYFYFYNVTSIRGFTSMITAVCEKTIIILVFPTASIQAPKYALYSSYQQNLIINANHANISKLMKMVRWKTQQLLPT